MSDTDDDVGSQMVRDLGLDPGLDVDDDQEFETLRELQEEDAEKDEKGK